MPDKPSYLGLLNAVAVNESAAAGAFEQWAESTSDKRLQKTLRLVAMREAEHGLAFAKRMMELGYEVREPAEEPQGELRRIVASGRSDASKLRGLKFHKAPSGTDVFDSMFEDKTIDPVTGGLLGRYIAEERDTVRRLSVEFDRLDAKEKKAKERAKARASTSKATKKK